MKVWTLGVPSSALALVGLALGLAGCPKGEPSQPGYEQPPTAPAQPEPEVQPPAGWEPYDTMSNEHADLAKNALSEGLRALQAMIKDQKIAGMDELSQRPPTGTQ